MNKNIDEQIHEIEAEFESNLEEKIRENAQRYNRLFNERLYRLPDKPISKYFSHLLNDYKQKPTNKTKKTIINSIENILYLLEETDILLFNEVLIGNIALKKTHVLSQEIKTLIRDRQELLENISKTELKRREAENKLPRYTVSPETADRYKNLIEKVDLEKGITFNSLCNEYAKQYNLDETSVRLSINSFAKKRNINIPKKSNVKF